MINNIKNSNLKNKYEANIKNLIIKNVSNVTNQIISMERYETKKLNTSTLDEIVGYRYNGF